MNSSPGSGAYKENMFYREVEPEKVINMKAKTPEEAIPKRLWMIVWYCEYGWYLGFLGNKVFTTRKNAQDEAARLNRVLHGKYKIFRVK